VPVANRIYVQVGDTLRISRPLLQAIHQALSKGEDSVTIAEVASSRDDKNPGDNAELRIKVTRELF
jgi:hypothetical protein